jgi:type IX secretion system PorP/SprF family membrane protein
LFLSAFCIKANGQQTIQFSQYVFSGLAVNPAYAGYKDEWTANLNYRVQWTGIDGAPRSGIISFDGLTDNIRKNVGLGIIATTDHLGPQNISSVYANYAYRLRLDEDDTRRLSFGIAFGAIQYGLDGSKFNATNIGDSSIPGGNESQLSPDLRAGVYYYTPQFYLGASVLNILPANFTDNYTIIKQVPHFYLTGGMLFTLSDYLDLKPSFLLKEDLKGPTNLDLSSHLLINKLIWIGASYRTAATLWNKSNLQRGLYKKDAIAALLEVYCNSNLRLGYSFDFNTSKFAGYDNGSHEISISLSLRGKKPRILSPRYF